MNNEFSTKSKKIWVIIRWVLGIWFVLGFFSGFVQGDILIGLVSLLIGLVLLPIKYTNRKKIKVHENTVYANSYTAISNQKIIKNADGDGTEKIVDEMGKNKLTTDVVQSLIVRKAIVPDRNTQSLPNVFEKKSSLESDESIIDITGQDYILPQPKNSAIQPLEVVPWGHRYVYSYEELQTATNAQKQYYSTFKNAFRNKQYLDLNGNTNYAFILLFDLLREYDHQHQDIQQLENDLQNLGENYPKTYSYGNSLLQKRLLANSDRAGVIRIQEKQDEYYRGWDDWRMGNHYAKKISLSKEQITLLNSFSYSKGVFCEVDECFIEILKLFNNVIIDLEEKFNKEKTTLSSVIEEISDVAARKNKHFSKGSENYKWFVGYHKHELYEYILKRCDNAVRGAYKYGRMKNADCSYTNKEAIAVFTVKLEQPITEILKERSKSINQATTETEVKLNEQITTRWKEPFEAIIKNLTKETAIDCRKDIDQLAELNIKNSSIENIFYEASKLFAPISREISVSYYLKYVNADMASARVNAKPLTKTALKHIFKNPEEAKEFEQLIEQLRTGKSIEEVLKKSTSIFEKKRKRIQIDIQTVSQIKTQHSDTVEILNEILKEEEELQAKSNDLLEVPFTMSVLENIPPSVAFHSTPAINLSTVQFELLSLFATNDFILSANSLDAFAKEKSLFKNGLIDSLNEQCYEVLDDILIEESGEEYQMNATYYNKIIL